MKLDELRRALRDRGLAPRPALGQRFLADPSLAARIPSDAGVQRGDRVLEVGAGGGALTEELLRAGAEVLAVEVDRGLAAWLRERFGAETQAGRLRVVEGDVLAPGDAFHPEVELWWATGPLPRLVSNLPYGISGPFLGRLPGRALASGCLLLQREMAERAAAGGGRAASPLSIRLGLAFSVRLGRRVPPAVFWPRPAVESLFLHLSPREGAPVPEEDRHLAAVLKRAFGQRRKRLLPRLRQSDPPTAAALEALGVAEDARPEDVPAALWLQAVRAARMAFSAGGGGSRKDR